MKKFFAILLSLALIMSLCTVAFAAGEANTEVTVTRSYKAYKLLDLTISLKEDEHHPACPVDTDSNAEHLDGCYNYSYRFEKDAGEYVGNAATYRKILQKETQAKGGNYVWGTAGEAPANYEDVTDDQILKYLANQDDVTMPSVAGRIYHAIVEYENLNPDMVITADQVATISQGYWLFVDATPLNGEYAANSLIVMDTKGLSTLTISPKVALPTSTMSVKNIDDSEILGTNIMGQPWAAAADYDIGDSIPYKMVATVPENVLNYTTYQMAFDCTMSAGLSLNDEIELVDMGEGVQFFVKMYDSINVEEADGNMDGGTDVTTAFTLTKNTENPGNFTVSCANIKAITGLKSTSVFAVYFETELNENAEIGNPGNTIESYLKFTNSVTDSNSFGQTVPTKLAVFTYQFVVNKIDEQNHPLKGAGFTLFKLNRAGEATVVMYDLTPEESNNGTKFVWTGLDDGDYKLVETTVPNGYNAMDPITFTIWSEFGTGANGPVLTLLTDGENAADADDGIITKSVVNKTGSVLPETGAAGTMMLIGFGTALVVVAAVFMITRKKMSIYKD